MIEAKIIKEPLSKVALLHTGKKIEHNRPISFINIINIGRYMKRLSAQNENYFSLIYYHSVG